MLPKVVFQFTAPVARNYDSFHHFSGKRFQLEEPIILDDHTIEYPCSFFADEFSVFSFVGWFVDVFFSCFPDTIDLGYTDSEVIFHLVYSDKPYLNKSIIFVYE